MKNDLIDGIEMIILPIIHNHGNKFKYSRFGMKILCKQIFILDVGIEQILEFTMNQSSSTSSTR